MRIDKYLKNARWIKRRTLAKDACDQGKIQINDKIAKPGTEVAVGDLVSMHFGNKKITIRVTHLDDHVKKDESKLLYEVVSEENTA